MCIRDSFCFFGSFPCRFILFFSFLCLKTLPISNCKSPLYRKFSVFVSTFFHFVEMSFDTSFTLLSVSSFSFIFLSVSASLLPVLRMKMYEKKNVPWHILAPRRGCFGNHLLLRRVRFLRSIFCMIGRNFLSYKKKRMHSASPLSSNRYSQ